MAGRRPAEPGRIRPPLPGICGGLPATCALERSPVGDGDELTERDGKLCERVVEGLEGTLRRTPKTSLSSEAASQTSTAVLSSMGLQKSVTSIPPLTRCASSRTDGSPFFSVLSVSGDLVSGRREHPPVAAEVVEALTADLALARVSGEPVERVVAVGDLHAAVGPAGPTEQRCLDPGYRVRPARCEQRRPVGGAGARAGALALLVLGEEIQRATV